MNTLKKNMALVIDTNVLIDVICKRGDFFPAANSVLQFCDANKIKGIIAPHSITNIFYILRKDFSDTERRKILLQICNTFQIGPLDKDKLINALLRKNFKDFEDCLQDECAIEFNADYIITRDTSDFKESKIPAITPTDFLKLVSA